MWLENPFWIPGASLEGQPVSPGVDISECETLKDIVDMKKLEEQRRVSLVGTVLLGCAVPPPSNTPVSCVQTLGWNCCCVYRGVTCGSQTPVISHTLQKSGHLYPRPCNIAWVEGELPTKVSPCSLPNNPAGDVYRRVIAPAFGSPHVMASR